MAAALALAVTLPAISAHAAVRDRVFVASYGSDSNPCTFGSPCKTFQVAVNAVAVNGEVTAIDSAGFGPVTITQSVTITSPVGVEAGIQAFPGGDAIDINAPGANVTLRGLTLNGAGVGNNGIVFFAGASLTVTDCVAQNFSNTGPQTTGNGILLEPTSGTVTFVITNTIVSNNGGVGIFYFPQIGSATANGSIDHVVATNNQYGISFNNVFAGGSTSAVISNSVASNNNSTGIYIQNQSAVLAVSIDNVSAMGNAFGIDARNTSAVFLSRSLITSNSSFGINNGTGAANSFHTYGDNRLNGNGSLGTEDLSGSSLDNTFNLH